MFLGLILIVYYFRPWDVHGYDCYTYIFGSSVYFLAFSVAENTRRLAIGIKVGLRSKHVLTRSRGL